jgi:hypothetical protein
MSLTSAFTASKLMARSTRDALLARLSSAISSITLRNSWISIAIYFSTCRYICFLMQESADYSLTLQLAMKKMS